MSLFLVTGGCGFIGSHLAEALLREGHRVRVLDDLSTGKLSNLPGGIEVLQGDVADPAIVRKAMTGVAGCFHLAAVASVERSNEDWVGTHRTNLTGAITIFDAARRAGPGASPIPVVYASSAAVYGDCPELPLRETSRTRPLSAYGADKLGCEQHAFVASHVHGVPTCGMRFFNVFGPRQDPRSPYSGVISIFCDRLASGGSIAIHGDGGQIRDFVYVGDVVRALLRAMGRAGTDAPVFNVCTGNPTTILQLAQSIASLVGAGDDFAFGPPRAGDVRASLGDPSHAKSELRFTAEVTLREGLGATLDSLATRHRAA